MGNLNHTISTFQNMLDKDPEPVSTLMLVTANGVYFGEQEITRDPKLFTAPSSYVELGYSIANFFSEEDLEDLKKGNLSDLDFSETILLKNAKFKIGRTIMDIGFTVINVNQIISVQIVLRDKVDEMLQGF